MIIDDGSTNKAEADSSFVDAVADDDNWNVIDSTTMTSIHWNWMNISTMPSKTTTTIVVVVDLLLEVWVRLQFAEPLYVLAVISPIA